MDGSVRFVIEDEGAVRIDASGATADDGDADCTITASAETFQDLLAGELDPTAAFMSGRLTIDGDMGLAMRLGSLLGMTAGRRRAFFADVADAPPGGRSASG